MQGMSYQFLPGPSWAAYKHSAKVWRNPPKLRKHLQHERTSSNNPGKLTSIQQFMLKFLRFASNLSLGQQLRDPASESFHIEGLVEIITRAFLDGLNR
jgi:hypothetical protein